MWSHVETQVRSAIHEVETAYVRDHLWRRPLPARLLLRDHKHVPLEHMRSIVGTGAIKQATILFPIEPSNIEGPVSEADESGINRPTTLEQRIAHPTGVE